MRQDWIGFTLQVLFSIVTMRLYGALRGLPAFAQAALQHLPAARVDPATHAMLREPAQGRLHPPWK